MKLTRKIPLVVVAILLACFSALIIALTSSITLRLRSFFEGDLAYKADRLDATLAGRSERALKAADWFESSDRLLDALRGKDRAKAVELGKSAMESFGFDYFILTDERGLVFARAHDPGAYGDSIADQLNVQAALRGEKAVFVEEGKVVKYSIRAGAPLRSPDGKIAGAVSFGFVLSSEAFVDEMKSLFRCDVTLFQGMERIATTIAVDGKRIAGTRLEHPEIERIVLGEGKPYVGQATILGRPYYVSYRPILGAGGKATGMIFIGEDLTIMAAIRRGVLVWDLAALGVILLVLSAGIVVTVRGGLRPLIRISEKLAEGENDLSLRFDDSGGDEVSDMAVWLNSYFERLRDLVRELKEISSRGGGVGAALSEGATEVSATVEEIDATMRSISEGISSLEGALGEARGAIGDIDGRIDAVVALIEEQSAAIAQSSASVEELIGSISGISEVTQAKRKLSAELAGLATKGDRDMAQTLQAIKSVGGSAELIRGMVAVIRSVANRTNLLAMNAAIEAAHAGQYGRGFAVVAEEIRKLSEATASSLKEIRDTIDKVAESIRAAEETSVETGSTISTLIAGIGSIDDAMEEASLGMREMSEGTGQISQALERLVSSSADIKESSARIKVESSSIRRTIEAVSDRSRETVHAVQETAAGLGEIMKSMQFLAEKGTENAEGVARLDSQINRFKT
jgi:methyl-accepting chemotaxis protein